MIELKTKLRKWGNSLGIVVPLHKVKESHMREGEEVVTLILKKKGVNLHSLFGGHKTSKSTRKLMREIDSELYNE